VQRKRHYLKDINKQAIFPSDGCGSLEATRRPHEARRQDLQLRPVIWNGRRSRASAGRRRTQGRRGSDRFPRPGLRVPGNGLKALRFCRKGGSTSAESPRQSADSRGEVANYIVDVAESRGMVTKSLDFVTTSPDFVAESRDPATGSIDDETPSGDLASGSLDSSTLSGGIAPACGDFVSQSLDVSPHPATGRAALRISGGGLRISGLRPRTGARGPETARPGQETSRARERSPRNVQRRRGPVCGLCDRARGPEAESGDRVTMSPDREAPSVSRISRSPDLVTPSPSRLCKSRDNRLSSGDLEALPAAVGRGPRTGPRCPRTSRRDRPIARQGSRSPGQFPRPDPSFAKSETCASRLCDNISGA